MLHALVNKCEEISRIKSLQFFQLDENQSSCAVTKITELITGENTRIKDEPSDWNTDFEMNTPSGQKTVQQLADIESKNISIEEDDHWYYLRSLLPFFRQLDNLQTLRVRTKFQQILMQEFSGNEPSASLFNVSSSNQNQNHGQLLCNVPSSE